LFGIELWFQISGLIRICNWRLRSKKQPLRIGRVLLHWHHPSWLMLALAHIRHYQASLYNPLDNQPNKRLHISGFRVHGSSKNQGSNSSHRGAVVAVAAGKSMPL
jgi:hypothetical protein